MKKIQDLNCQLIDNKYTCSFLVPDHRKIIKGVTVMKSVILTSNGKKRFDKVEAEGNVKVEMSGNSIYIGPADPMKNVLSCNVIDSIDGKNDTISCEVVNDA